VTRDNPIDIASQAHVPSSDRPAVDVTPVAWTPRRPLPLGDWINYGRRFGTVGRACGWWIGDWLNFGNVAYGEKYSRAARVSKYDVQTLMNMAYVASRFEISRRRENISWSHHAELAALPQELQNKWLDHIEANRLTVRDLRQEMRRERKTKRSTRSRQELPAPQENALDSPSDPQYRCPKCGHPYGPLAEST
jgi:hypothetical protein